MHETRADRLATIGGCLYLLSSIISFIRLSTGGGGQGGALRWTSIGLFIIGNVAFIFAALNIVGIEFAFMPRFLRGRED
jgi:hypothetical protein